MNFSDFLADRLSLPVIAAPMFLASNTALVVECCKAGVVGTFPALNLRSSDAFENALVEIKSTLATYETETGKKPAPYGVNIVVHPSNPRVKDDIALCVKHKVPLVITAFGSTPEIVKTIQSYGGFVIHDAINIKHARKAAASGVDGIIAVACGSGGHSGALSPFALINEIHQFFDKPVLLSGAISSGSDIAAAQMMGADFVYMGTRFLATQECNITTDYKQMLTETSAAEIIYTPAVSGVNANFLKPSLQAAGIDAKGTNLQGMNVSEALNKQDGQSTAKPWKDIWSAGQGVGSIQDFPATCELVARLKIEYADAVKSKIIRLNRWLEN